MVLNNLLQMTEGFLSESLSVNIVMLFDMDIEDDNVINETLYDCNKLRNLVEFNYLSKKEAKKLLKVLNIEGELKKGDYKLNDLLSDRVVTKKNKSKISL